MKKSFVAALGVLIVAMTPVGVTAKSFNGLGTETAYSGIKGYLNDRKAPAPTTSVVTDENSNLYDHDKAGLRWNSDTLGKDRGVSGADPGWGLYTSDTAPSQQ